MHHSINPVMTGVFGYYRRFGIPADNRGRTPPKRNVVSSSLAGGASSSQAIQRLRRAFLFHCKARRARILLLFPASKQAPSPPAALTECGTRWTCTGPKGGRISREALDVPGRIGPGFPPTYLLSPPGPFSRTAACPWRRFCGNRMSPQRQSSMGTKRQAMYSI